MEKEKIELLVKTIKDISHPAGVEPDSVDVQDLLEEIADIFGIGINQIETWYENA